MGHSTAAVGEIIVKQVNWLQLYFVLN